MYRERDNINISIYILFVEFEKVVSNFEILMIILYLTLGDC